VQSRRWNQSDGELVFDQWSKAVEKFPGELFKVIPFSPRFAPSGPAWEAYTDVGSGKNHGERLEESIRLFETAAAPFIEFRRNMRDAGARVVRLSVFDDSPEALATPGYPEKIRWMSNIYGRTFAGVEETYFRPRSAFEQLEVPEHDVAVFRFDRPEGSGVESEIRASTARYWKGRETWDVMYRTFHWQGPDGDIDDMSGWEKLRNGLDEFLRTNFEPERRMLPGGNPRDVLQGLDDGVSFA
jgi:hypothetical protein